MERISSPVMASVPQPKETSCTSSMSGCPHTYRAALYIRAWKVHWLSTFRGAYSSWKATASSLTTTKPKEAANSLMPWLISGSMW